MIDADTPAPALGVDAGLYQEIAEHALAATRGALRRPGLAQPSGRNGDGGGLGGGASMAVSRALAAVRRIVPNYDPVGLTFPAAANPWVRAVHLEGRTMLGPFLESAQERPTPSSSALPNPSWAPAIRSVPLRTDAGVVGSLGFCFRDRLSSAVQQTAEAFVQQATLSVLNARLAVELRQRMDELRLSWGRVTAAEDRLRREVAALLHGRVQTRLLVAWHPARGGPASVGERPGLGALAAGRGPGGHRPGA